MELSFLAWIFVMSQRTLEKGTELCFHLYCQQFLCFKEQVSPFGYFSCKLDIQHLRTAWQAWLTSLCENSFYTTFIKIRKKSSCCIWCYNPCDMLVGFIVSFQVKIVQLDSVQLSFSYLTEFLSRYQEVVILHVRWLWSLKINAQLFFFSINFKRWVENNFLCSHTAISLLLISVNHLKK